MCPAQLKSPDGLNCNEFTAVQAKVMAPRQPAYIRYAKLLFHVNLGTTATIFKKGNEEIL